MKEFTSVELNNFESARSLEWLETNGLGGYASSTVSGANSRRYHCLLVAAMHPPVGRMVLVSKLEEALQVGEQRFELGSNQYPGAIYPEGFKHLTKFERDLFPVFCFEAGGVVLKKTVACLHGENTTLVMYEVLQAPSPFVMEWIALYSCKDFHSEAHANDNIHHNYLFQDGVFRTFNYQGCPEFFISVPGSEFQEHKTWYYNFEHAVEHYRGLDFKEDLFTHGKFKRELKQGDCFGIVLSTEDPSGRDAVQLFNRERKRREEIVKGNVHQQWRALVLAADQFIVKRGELNTIIAGYPWFSDWGRDTMIALPGLCLATGRWNEARNILRKFSENVSEGMLPNRFPDYGEAPEYNTFDATLWFFVAVYKYYQASQDAEFVKEVLPVLQDIIQWHIKGTRYQIKVDESDGLLRGGQPGVQLTWMDAKVGDWVVTPRIGKPVEINALWYNALKIFSQLSKGIGAEGKINDVEELAKRVLSSFNEKFWNKEASSLYDCIADGSPNAEMRPNQLYAISLPFPLLTKEKAKKVLKAVEDHLATPKGLRSLNREHPDYKPSYGGTVWQRDGAYHQGTVWSFLIGPYIDAILFVEGAKGKPRASKILNEFLQHLDEGCVGSVSEIFDAELPHAPRGCFAQAWGVAEPLRVMAEHNLSIE